MVSKNQKKLIKSLHQKKYRKQYQLFVAEGIKVVKEFLDQGYELQTLFTVDKKLFEIDISKVQEVSNDELKSISYLTTPQKVIGLFNIPKQRSSGESGITLLLDDVRDPGNLGTIIRLCDWFGIYELVCSLNTVDCYNPKVVQSTMGSIARVNVVYQDLEEFITSQKNRKVYGAFMQGDVVYGQKLDKNAILIMGNEANGISENIEKLITQRISIPQFGDQASTESLNVATATAILLNEFRRS